MAYDQGYYQSAQRPYNGRAAQRPGLPQVYNQQPQQNYPPQQHDQYADDGYGYDNYDDGYGQGYDEGFVDPYAGGRGNGYPPPNLPPSRGPLPPRDYPPQQEYYGNDRGGAYPPRGSGRGGPPPMQRPNPEGQRGGYDSRGGGPGRGYVNSAPNGNGAPVGRGGRPAPLDRTGSSDQNMRGSPGPGGQMPRKPLKTPPISPDTVSWDTPFPTFPGAKKKTSITEEREIMQKMNNMDLSQGRPRTAGSKGSQDKYPRGASTDDYGRPSLERRPNDERRPTDDYGRASSDNQRNVRGPPQGPPPQGYQDPRRGPPPQSFGPPVRTNTYQEPGFNDRAEGQTPTSPMRANFGPPSRSMTMPNETPMPNNQRPSLPLDAGPSALYNGPVGRGRGLPARPSTASSSRPPPQRTYPPPDPPMNAYANGGDFPNHDRGESISDFYDDYYNAPDPHARNHSGESEMPNFDVAPVHPGVGKRGASIDQHMQPQPMNSQQGFGGRGQPQGASFDVAGDAQRQNAYPNQRYDDGFGQYNPRDQRAPPPQGYDDHDIRPPPPNTFLPPRPASAASRPGPGFAGLPGGPRPGYPNGPPQNGEVERNSFPGQVSPGGQGLPSHPPPVRAGLIPNSVAAQANNKPPPVRNYANVSPAQQPGSSPSPSASSVAPPQAPVTTAELEQLRITVRNSPNDQVSAMLLVKRLVEASEVLVPTIPDQRARNKAREKYIMDAHKILKKLVAVQNTEAMFYLADCYGRGALGLETEPKEAFTLYQSAAKAGHSAAAYRTAVCCELGSDDGGGTRKDPLKAIQWYKRAAMLGDTPAMYKMGMIQLKGLLGQPKNHREAVGWLKRAAERADLENPHALHELGLLYEAPQTPDGSLVRDEAYSFKLFRQAADLGYKFSQFRLGCAYEYGLFNCLIDPRISIAWYSKAAQQEEHQSELALSGWYLTGSEGVLQQSDTEAYLWARKAAMAGLAKAEYAMGYFTEVGIGSPANLEDAKRWYWRAAAQNFPKARERLEDLKRGGSKASLKSRERISRSKVGKQNEGECAVM